MKAKRGTFIAVLFLFVAVCVLRAQEKPSFLPGQTPFPSNHSDESTSGPNTYYRLDFVIRELDGEKLVDTRNYSLWVQSGIANSTSAGSEVPYPSSSFSDTGSGTTRSISYRSIGVTISCRVKEDNEGPQLESKLNISDVLPPEQDSDPPTFRKITLDSRALLSLGKQTTIGIVEDPASRRRYEVNVITTKLE